MNALLTRCRHIRVNWLDTHSCTCLECGKTGTLVRDGENGDVDPKPENRQSQTVAANQSASTDQY